MIEILALAMITYVTLVAINFIAVVVYWKIFERRMKNEEMGMSLDQKEVVESAESLLKRIDMNPINILSLFTFFSNVYSTAALMFSSFGFMYLELAQDYYLNLKTVEGVAGHETNQGIIVLLEQIQLNDLNFSNDYPLSSKFIDKLVSWGM